MISEVLRDNLLLLATTYAKAKGVTLGSVSFRFYGQSPFFDELRRGKRSVSTRLVDEMLIQFSQEWPDNAPWPKLRGLEIRRDGRQIYVDSTPLDKRVKRITL